uniref:Uncharacterized protein n=1 Tax=Arundo donax TaxID=35708 RepID=A0A0A9BJZ6_ARUDO
MLGSNYWGSCRDHDVFGGIAYSKIKFPLLLFDLKFTKNCDFLKNFESIPNVIK